MADPTPIYWQENDDAPKIFVGNDYGGWIDWAPAATEDIIAKHCTRLDAECGLVPMKEVDPRAMLGACDPAPDDGMLDRERGRMVAEDAISHL